MSGPNAGGMAAAADQRIVRQLLGQGATTAERAVAFQPEQALDGRRFERLRQAGVVREAGAGLFYLDEAAWSRVRRGRLIMVVVLLAITFLIMAAVLYIA